MNIKKLFIAAILVSNIGISNATSDRTLPLGQVLMENIKVEGRIQTWTFQKLCIDGQAYLLIPGISGPNGISASFKDGKPEQCIVKDTQPK